MNTRILSLAALTGMLAATGCGGGSGPGAVTPTTGLAPTIGGGVGSSSSKRSLTISFAIPTPASLQTSSSSRTPRYVSPGTTGVNLYLTSAAAPTGVTAVLEGAQQTALNAATPTALLTNFVPTSLSGSFTFSGAAIATLTGGTATSTVTAPYNIALSGAYSVLTLTIPGITGTVGGNDQFVRVGAVFTDSSGYVLSEGQAPSVVDINDNSTGAGRDANSIGNFKINAAGPTEVSLVLNPVPATVYLFGSSGVLGALGPPITPDQAAAVTTLLTAGSYEVTAYVADHAGYVIPAQTVTTSTANSSVVTNVGFTSVVSGALGVPSWASATASTSATLLAFDAGANYTLTTNQSGSVTVSGGPGVLGASARLQNLPLTGVSVGLDPIPATTQTAFATAASSTTASYGPGYLVSGVALPSGTVSGYGTYSAGLGVNIIPTSAASASTASLYAVLTEPHVLVAGPDTSAHGLVSGFSYSSTNYPAASGNLGTPGAPGTAATITVPLSPSVVPVIQ